MTRAIVLGANGYIGQQLCYWLTTNGFAVSASGRQSQFAGQTPILMDYRLLNLTDRNSLRDYSLDADLIFFLAGCTGTSIGFRDYMGMIESNEVALLNLLDELNARRFRGRLVFPSTRLVYKGKAGGLLREDDEKEPKTPYAINKLAAEYSLQAWANAFGLGFTAFRICVPYGKISPASYRYGTLGFLIGQALEKKEIVLFGDGSQRRTFTDIRDVCEIMVRASMIPSTNGRILNIGSRDNYSLAEAAMIIAKTTGATLRFASWPPLERAIESGDTVFSDNELQRVFPYEYKGDLEEYLTSLH